MGAKELKESRIRQSSGDEENSSSSGSRLPQKSRDLNSSLSGMIKWLRQRGFLWSKEVENAMLAVERAYFVPEEEKALSYSDNALPIGYGQTISAPTVVAFMLEKLELKKGMNVLEVGTGSGYNTALLAKIVGKNGKVTTIEAIPELTALAKNNIKRLGNDYANIEFIVGDGSCGYEKNAPYDAIIVTAAMPLLNETHPLAKQLKNNGRLIAPVGDRYFQDLVLYYKNTGAFEKVLGVMFVPLIGEYGF